jgi:hypothetical protein
MWLNSNKTQIVRQQFDKLWKDELDREDERKFLEAVYQHAQRARCGLSGYELRFVIYWYLGKKRGRWA